jgi:hypothetical protein
LIKDGVIASIQNEEHKVELDTIPSKFQDSVNKCLIDQAAIGWDAAIKGYLSVEWRFKASLGPADGDNAHEGRGFQTIRTILKSFHDFTQAIWQSRNQELHGKQEMETKLIRQTEIAEITELHGHPELVPAGDRHYSEQPLGNILARAPSTRRRWLRHMRSARRRFLNEGSRQPLMTEFFRREGNITRTDSPR